MILALRTDKPESEIYIYDGSGKLAYKHSWQAHRKLAETLHTEIATALKQTNKKLKDFSGIVVFEGPGSFTGLRIGMSVANTLAYASHIPVVAAGGHAWQKDGIQKLASGTAGKYALPVYGSSPHITQQKK